MAKGGHGNSGPPPDPNALRRDGEEWMTLPAEGRVGPAPEWPLSVASERELVLWAGEWSRPQAVMWERNRQELEVALYVRSVVAAEDPDAKTNARTLVRQQQEALGLSLPGLRRNGWLIGQVVTQQRGADSGPERARFKVVSGGAA